MKTMKNLFGTCPILLAALLALATPLRADNPPIYAFQWGGNGSGNGQFYYAEGVAVDSSNNVYVTDSIQQPR